MCRLTVKGCKAVNFVSNVYVHKADWSTDAGKVVGNTPAAHTANRVLTKLRDDLNDIHADLERQKRPVTPQAIFRIYRQADQSPLSLLGLFNAFLEEQGPLVNIEKGPRTVEAYRVRFRRVQEYLQQSKQSDLRPEDFNSNVADKLRYWLQLTRGYKINTAAKLMQTVNQVLSWGVRREYLMQNPLQGYRLKRTAPGEIVYLEEEELEELSCFEFASAALGKVRDCFVLQCWTGLAYADLAALDVPSCVETRNGRRILRVRRAKSTVFQGYECVIPLLPEAERVLAHYKDKPPVPCNQLYNRCLKQIGQMVGLDVAKMKTHTGRKTAGVLLLNSGIPMEVVSKILGHSSVRMTEKVYAKILDQTVTDAIDKAFGSINAPTSGFEPESALAETGRIIQFRLGAQT